MSKISEIFFPASFSTTFACDKFYSLALLPIPTSLACDTLKSETSDHNLYDVNELGSGISYLFHNDFMAICGESFVISSSICILIYGVISNRPEMLLTQGIAKALLLQKQPFTERHNYTKKNEVEKIRSSSAHLKSEVFEVTSPAYGSPRNLGFRPSFLRYLQNTVDIKDKGFAYAQASLVHQSTFSNTKFESLDRLKTNFLKGQQVNFESAPILVRNCGVHALLILFFAVFLLINNPLYGEVFYNSLVIDYFTRFMQISICLASLFSVCISLQYLQKINTYELVVLILLAVASMLLLTSASDLICVYAAIEFQSLCFYVLAGLKRNSESSTEAGLKYLLLGAFSSGILLFGCSLLYTFTGTSSFFEYAHLLSNSEYNNNEYSTLLGTSQFMEKQSLSDPSVLPLRACQLGFTFLLVGLLFKCAAAPFHMWVPDVYEGAPTAITAFFSIVPKLSLFAVLIRLLSLGTFEGCITLKSQTFDPHSSSENGYKSLAFFDQTSYNSLIESDTKELLLYGGGPYSVLLFSCIASLLIGTFSAISQNKIKRLLAYSSIGHVGFLLIGCTLHSGEGLVAVLVYLLIYIAMTIPMFAYMLSPLARERYVQLSGFR